MTDLASVQVRVRRTLRTVSAVRCREIAVNLYLVCRDRKPCLLWDFCDFLVSGVSELCLDLVGEQCVILNLDSDYLIFKRAVMVSHLTNLILKPPVFLDVGGDKLNPEPCSKPIVGTVLESVQDLLNVVEKNANSFLSPGVRPGWNLSTMFGILLGYPVVYWFPPTQDKNCLSNNDLCVFSVSCQGCVSFSFSVPLSALSKPVRSEINSCICKVWPELDVIPPWGKSLVIDSCRVEFSNVIVNKPVVVL